MIWDSHYWGKGGLIPSLNKRLYTISKIKKYIPIEKLPRLAHALWTSKLRYGLQLCSNVRIKHEDSQNSYMQSAEVAQNKMLRLLNNSTLTDRTHTVDLLKNAKMLSVNQLAASIKLLEAWKSCNVPDYPIQLEKNHENLIPNDRTVRPNTTRHWKEDGKFATARDSFSRSTAKLWNQAPLKLKEANSLKIAKMAINEYCQL